VNLGRGARPARSPAYNPDNSSRQDQERNVMTVGTAAHTYQWIDQWARIPDTPSGRANGRTHGVAVSKTGNVIVFHQADPAVLIFDADGNLQHAWGHRFDGAHGLTLVEENGAEYLWLTDQNSGEVVKTTLDGKTVLNLTPPELPAYQDGRFSPTWVAVNEQRHGGNGDVFVTDGYGQNYIHRYDKIGNCLGSFNGEQGKAGAFSCPHGIWIDTRKDEPELYIADRGSKRVQVYDVQGKFKRVFGSDFLTSPCGFITHGQNLIIPELRARVTILDADDKLVTYVGDNERVCDLEGWPNHKPELIEPGKFNSPHGIAADKQGNLYVVEWIIGGRITKLARQ
jgi:DNA-binding beta-propeller fold protein YncE